MMNTRGTVVSMNVNGLLQGVESRFGLIAIRACAVLMILVASFSNAAAQEPSSGAQSADEQPFNFVFILADDLGCKDLSVEGSTFYESPNIDRLAQRGVRFTQGYAACQVCSPSRASIMTGKFPARHGITDWIGAKWGKDWTRNGKMLPAKYQMNLSHADTTMAEALRSAGYRTFFAGKWHLGGEGSYPEDHGFEFNAGGHERGSPPGGYFSPYRNPKLEDGEAGESLPMRLAEETASFIEQHRDEPFLAFLSFYSVHGPIQTSKERWQKYRDKAEASGLANSRFLIDRTLPVRQVQDNPIYAGMIETMDDAVGKVLDTLEQLELDDRTVVVFTSDNGGVSSGDAFATSNLPFRGGKGRQWEGGIREPYYLFVPGAIANGGVCDVPVTGTDFYPTFLELAGLELDGDQHADGVSLVPLLEKGKIAKRDLIWHYPHYGNQGGDPSSILRSGPWKLIHYWEDGHDELYHLTEDPQEATDVSQENPAMTQELRQRLDEYLASVDAVIPTADERFDKDRFERTKLEIKEKRLPNLERQHARFLESGFTPNKDWWGSLRTND